DGHVTGVQTCALPILREAIVNADSNPGLDTIEFAIGTIVCWLPVAPIANSMVSSPGLLSALTIASRSEPAVGVMLSPLSAVFVKIGRGSCRGGVCVLW